MTVWKIGIKKRYSNYEELSKRNVVAQGWPSIKDLTCFFRTDEAFIKHWLCILLPDHNMGQTTLFNLLSKIKKNDLVLAYEGKDIKGICQIPEDFTYKYEKSYHYANCLYPVQWVSWDDFVKSIKDKTFPTVSDELTYPTASGQGIKGIEKAGQSERCKKIETKWQEYIEKNADYFSNLESKFGINLKLILDSQDEEKKERFQEISCELITKTSSSLIKQLEVVPQMILYGAPGTGKTFLAKSIAAKFLGLNPCKIHKKDSEEEKQIVERKKFEEHRFSAQKGLVPQSSGCWDIIQFHSNFSYEDFIGGIRPKLDTNSKDLTYELVAGKFKQLCDKAAKTENKEKKFVFIIDEINRADLSAVFGELLYALEYRGDQITIPLFNNFVVPKNVFIIGTMNNVDKSLVTFDIALRRRFSFKLLETDMEVVRATFYKKCGVDCKTNIDQYVEKCNILNDSIKDEFNLSEEQQIGHAYFLRIYDYMEKFINNKKPEDFFEKIEDIQKCQEYLWEYHLDPLIEEYIGARISAQDYKDKIAKVRETWIKW